MAERIEVLAHGGIWLPHASRVDNRQLVRWTKEIGANGLEWFPAGPILFWMPVGPTHEVLYRSPEKLLNIFGDTLKRGHVVFAQASSVIDALLFPFRLDPLRKGKKTLPYKLIVAHEQQSKRALLKLQALRNGEFPITVYPPHLQITIPTEYKMPLLQTSPMFLTKNDVHYFQKSNEEIRDGRYAGWTWDLAHAWGRIPGTAIHPMGATEDDQKRNLEFIVKNGTLKEVHVQPPQFDEHEGVSDPRREFLGMLEGDYSTRTGRFLRFLTRELGFPGPYTLELDVRLLSYRFPLWKILFVPPNLSGMLDVHRACISYIKNA